MRNLQRKYFLCSNASCLLVGPSGSSVVQHSVALYRSTSTGSIHSLQQLQPA